MWRFLFAFCLLVVVQVQSLWGITRREINAPYVSVPITVDGSAADWSAIKSQGRGISFYKGDGYASTSTKLGTTCLGTVNDAADCRVDLWLAHNAVYLYVLAEVRDDDYESFGTANHNMAYLEDTLHLYIDSTNALRDNIPNPPIYNQTGYEQFGISTDGNIYGENTDFNNTGSARQAAPQGAAPDGTYWRAQCQVQTITAGGSILGYRYTFEERIALAGRPGRNMAAMAPGNSYGFNAEWCDADNGTQLQGWIFWSSKPSIDAWNYENLWGTMHLAPVPEPAAALFLGLGGILGWRKKNRR